MAVLPFELDPLIAEAKLRMRRRRFLVLLLVLAIVGGVVGATLALRDPPGGGQPPAALPARHGISRIPAMTRIIAYSNVGGSVCSGMKGTAPRPVWCSAVKLRHGWFEQWILTSAVRRYGRRTTVPLPFARQHPGPAVVSDEVLTLATRSQAELLLRTPDFTGSWDTVDYTSLPEAAINGGIAGRIEPGFDGPETRFMWVSGTSIVEVNVSGVNLTPVQAQQIARLARPA
jgi:hypothetical protein